MNIRYGIKILFIILFLLGGCATTKPSAMKKSRKKELLAGVVFFKELQQIDLDKDGEKEILAIYAAGADSTGVRVIKSNRKKGEHIIFERVFNTPDVKLKLKAGAPYVIVRGSGQAAGCGLRKTYHWDGKAFVA